MPPVSGSNSTDQESTPETVEPTLITEFWLLDMEMKVEKISTWLKTVGELDGENKDTSNF